MVDKPECLELMPRETIRRHLDDLPLVGVGSILQEVQAFLKFASILPNLRPSNERLVRRLGILPAILAHGRSGTGKTSFGYYLFLSIADELSCDINYYRVRFGSLLNPNLGQTSRNIDELFDFVSACATSAEVAFIHFDEIDAISLSRARITEHDAIRRALSSLLSALDRTLLTGSNRWILYATTNVFGLVDPALLRRFSLKLDFDSSAWSSKEYAEFLLSVLCDRVKPPTQAAIAAVAKRCHQRRLTPNDTRELALRALLATELGNGTTTSLTQELRRLARSSVATPSIDRAGGTRRH